MMIFRLLIWALIFYFGYWFFKGFTRKSHHEEVQGEPKKSPLDLRDRDVSDARYEEVDEKE